jgi:enoyl-[acyl-carrier protein] reductase II
LLDSGAVEMAEAQLQIEHYWAGALRRAVIDGDVESGSVMAGQSVGMVKDEQPVAAIIQSLVDEAAAALERRAVQA